MKVSYHALKKENVADFLILTVREPGGQVPVSRIIGVSNNQ